METGGGYWLIILVVGLVAWFFTRKKKNENNNANQGAQNYQQSQSQHFTQNTAMGVTPNFCPNCGSKLTSGDKFCAGCGNKIG